MICTTKEFPKYSGVGSLDLSRLTPATRAQLKANAQGGVLRVGTLCSGTDSPIPVIEHLGFGLRSSHEPPLNAPRPPK
eukprot:364528-Amphidinium_carterae.1